MLSILMLKLMRYKRDILIVLIMAALSLVFISILGGPNSGTYKYSIMVATDEANPSYYRFMNELTKNKSYDFEEVDYDVAKAEVE